MDPARFDTLAKAVSGTGTGTRRSLMRLLFGVPLTGSLAALLELGEAPAAKRPLERVRDRKAHKQEQRHNGNGNKGNGNGKGNGKKKGNGGQGGSEPGPSPGQECTADSTACCASGRCRDEACVANYVTLVECQGRCDGSTLCTTCGHLGYAIPIACGPDPVSCPRCSCAPGFPPCTTTDDCAGHGCNGLDQFAGPAGQGMYCSSHGADVDCEFNACAPGEICSGSNCRAV